MGGLFDFSGADERSRTADLLITNQLLYQLSYIGAPSYSNGNRRRRKIPLIIDPLPIPGCIHVLKALRVGLYQGLCRAVPRCAVRVVLVVQDH